MAYTDNSVVITQKIVDLLKQEQSTLELAHVYYGDVDLIAEFPTVTVQSFPKERLLNEAGSRFELTLRAGIFVYHGQIQSADVNRKENEELAEAVEDVLHADYTLGGLVVFGYVSLTEPGIVFKESVMIKATRLTWEGLSKGNF